MRRPTHSRRMSNNYNNIPIGISVIQRLVRTCCPRIRCNKQLLFQASILVLTYLTYTCFHMARKPISVVKSVLHENCSDIGHNDTGDCGYAPFDNPDAKALFGTLDSAFLFSYAAAMFVSGYIAERVSIRYFLALGMTLSGIFTVLFGVAKTWNIHSLGYFLFVQACAGIVQTTGWPGVVTLVGRWFHKTKRGLIFGIWNSHTSIGNILGTLIAAYYVETDWAMSFIMPGIIMITIAFIVFLLLVDSPEIVGCHIQRRTDTRHHSSNDSDNEDEVNYSATERTPILPHREESQSAIGLLDALYIPGVVEFSLCLFFSKLVSYTFLYWLPLYIQSSSTLGPTSSADVSIMFDVGGIVGAIAAGTISDFSGMSATTCAVMLFFASPMLLIYRVYGHISLSISVMLLLIAGIFVNGPYALITTSVSAELGQHRSLNGNARALATVTAIIDGTGSIGAAIGPLLAGVISNQSWQKVFYMLIFADLIAMLSLSRLVAKECFKLRRTARIRIE